LENVKEHATLSAGATVDHGVEVETTEEHVNRAADRGCCVSTCSALGIHLDWNGMLGPNEGPEELHILGPITNKKTRIAITAIMNWNVTYRFAARPRESSRLSSGCCLRGAKSSFSSFDLARSNSDSVSAPDDLKSARRCSSSGSDILNFCRTSSSSTAGMEA